MTGQPTNEPTTPAVDLMNTIFDADLRAALARSRVVEATVERWLDGYSGQVVRTAPVQVLLRRLLEILSDEGYGDEDVREAFLRALAILNTIADLPDITPRRPPPRRR